MRKPTQQELQEELYNSYFILYLLLGEESQQGHLARDIYLKLYDDPTNEDLLRKLVQVMIQYESKGLSSNARAH